MKLSNRIALTISLSAGLFCGAALAQDAATAPAAPAAKPAHHHHHKGGEVHGVKYDNCLKEKLAVANAWCGAHSDACQAEKDGAAKQCKSEARGERQKG